ncbi:MAG TPA: response regulator [Chthoniobacter sp.]|nr:response regulator [Chthoniobacter sp.]
MFPERAIVVVDDDASMNQAMERLLTAAGWTTLMFASAEALLESDAPGMASGFILDIHLPGLSGFALHEKLQKAGFMAPVAFITAHDLEWVKKQAQLAGAIGYFVKPFDGRSLIETLDRNCSPV